MAEQQNDPAMLMVDSLETAALTKAQLAELLFEQIGLNKREAKEMVDAFFEQISQALVGGDEVSSRALATFSCASRRRVPGATRAPASSSPSTRAAWSPFTPAKSSRIRCKGHPSNFPRQAVADSPPAMVSRRDLR